MCLGTEKLINLIESRSTLENPAKLTKTYLILVIVVSCVLFQSIMSDGRDKYPRNYETHLENQTKFTRFNKTYKVGKS